MGRTDLDRGDRDLGCRCSGSAPFCACGAAQFLLLLLFVAVAAGIADILPFGPLSIGMRLSLWLVPVFVVGGASALDRVRTRLEGHTPIRVAFDVSAVVVAGVLIVGASTGLPTNHVNDRGNAAAYVEGALTKNDVVFIDHTAAMYSYTVASHLDVGIRARKELVAFEPDFRDPRFHYFEFAGDPTDRVVLDATTPGEDTNLARVIGRADRVYIYAPDAQLRGRFSFAVVLRRLGYEKVSDTRVQLREWSSGAGWRTRRVGAVLLAGAFYVTEQIGRRRLDGAEVGAGGFLPGDADLVADVGRCQRRAQGGGRVDARPRRSR